MTTTAMLNQDTIDQAREEIEGVAKLLYAIIEQPSEVSNSALLVLAQTLETAAERLDV